MRQPTRTFTIEGLPEQASLEGRLWSPAGAGPTAAAIVAPPHPQYGGSLDHPVVDDLVNGLTAAGHDVLGFNWRGVGRSAGVPCGDPESALLDYRAAALRLTSQHPVPHIAAGYSWGGGTAALYAAAEPGSVAGLVLVAPPVQMLAAVDPRTIRVPVFVFTGDSDPIAPLAALESQLAAFPDAQLGVIQQCDHFFMTVAPNTLRDLVVDALASAPPAA